MTDRVVEAQNVDAEIREKMPPDDLTQEEKAIRLRDNLVLEPELVDAPVYPGSATVYAIAHLSDAVKTLAGQVADLTARIDALEQTKG